MLRLDIGLQGLAPLEGKLEALGLEAGHAVLEVMLRTVQQQTRERIAQTKRGPDGEAWPVRKDDGKPALFHTGAFFDSIDYAMHYPSGEVGTGHVGARVHQFGAVIRPVNARALAFTLPSGRKVLAKKVTIPARPYLGVDGENMAELEEAVVGTLEAFL